MDLEKKIKYSFYDKETNERLKFYNKKFARDYELNKLDQLPLFIDFYCKIHNRNEFVTYIGSMYSKTKEVHLYNTDDGHTFDITTIFDMKFDLLPDGWWQSYDRKKEYVEQEVNDEEYWERFK